MNLQVGDIKNLFCYRTFFQDPDKGTSGIITLGKKRWQIFYYKSF